MKKIADKANILRDFVNYKGLYDLFFKNRHDEWNVLTVANDTLEDSTSALTHFEEVGIGNDVPEKYLRFYGMFQAVILQQDSLISLYQIFVESELKAPAKSMWQEMRRLRNMAAGHPLDKNGNAQEGKLRVFVSQISISSDGFDMIICEEHTGNMRSETVDLKKIWNGYKIEVLNYLSEIEKMQKLRWC